jgi:hypothetical protein
MPHIMPPPNHLLRQPTRRIPQNHRHPVSLHLHRPHTPKNHITQSDYKNNLNAQHKLEVTPP